MRLKHSFFVVWPLVILMSGCGDEAPGRNRGQEFGQVVDRIPYQIRLVELRAVIERPGQAREELTKVFRYDGDGSKDAILRLIDGSSFVLQVNDVKVDIPLSANGDIDHEGVANENTPGCSLTGLSHMQGSAQPLELNLGWTFDMSLTGESCDQTMVDKYFAFQEKELGRLHLKSVNDLLNATDLKKDLQRSLHFELKVWGESH